MPLGSEVAVDAHDRQLIEPGGSERADECAFDHECQVAIQIVVRDSDAAFVRHRECSKAPRLARFERRVPAKSTPIVSIGCAERAAGLFDVSW